MSEKLSDRLEAEAARTRAEWTRAPTLNPKTEPVHPEPMRLLLREAAAALRAVEGVCVWTIDDIDDIDESWDGSCGAKWQFTEGGPIENDMRHCPQCGKTIALVPLDAAGSAEGVG